MVFQIRAKTQTHCTSHIVDVSANRTDEFENGRQFSAYSKLRGCGGNRANDRIEKV